MNTYRVIVKRYGVVIVDRAVTALDSGSAADVILDGIGSPYEARFSVSVIELTPNRGER